MRRIFPIVGVLAGLMAVLSVAGRAENATLLLKSGASVRGDVLKRTDKRVILDLGFQILTVPVEEILSEEAPERADTETTDEAGDEKKPAGKKPRLKGTFKEMVDDLKEGVVVVSNATGFGAGFLIDSTGLLLTNHHVIRGEKQNNVTLFLNKEGGKKEKKIFREVEVKGFSSMMDCALLKIPDKALEGIELTVLDLAKPDTIVTGLPVFAIGNPGVGYKMLEHSVSEGILSSTTRNFNDLLYLQTTAAINPGNSGGPLLNSKGEVVGMVTFRAFLQEGVAFALPASYLSHFVRNVQAFAPGADTENTGYRYHNPAEDQKED